MSFLSRNLKSKETEMPKAFSLSYGLDLETEVASFWAWLHDVRELIDGSGEAGQQVKELVESQQQEVQRFIAAAPDPDAAKRMITLALAIVGSNYSSHQKLLNGLQEYGLLESPRQPRPRVFDTISGPTFEGPERPR
jgi:hypothetical protein